MPKIDFPVNPIRECAYTPDELYDKIDLDNPDSITETLDFRAYRDFIIHGGAFPNSYYTGMMRSLHDFSIWNSVQEVMETNKLIGIMGGHKMKRDVKGTYMTIVRLAWRLSREGYMLSSGGGPGAMEATHVGAWFSNYPEEILEEATGQLATVPEMPKNLGNFILHDGSFRQEIARDLFRFLKPAFKLLNEYPDGGNSLSIPTWLYGHEPSTPFAKTIAKYYQNSIREDGLLTVAKYGIIYTEGKAGTIQEIFQDATQNFYETVDFFSPMVFLGKKFWTEDYPVKKVLDKLMTADQCKKYLLYSDDEDEIVEFLKSFKPEPSVPNE